MNGAPYTLADLESRELLDAGHDRPARLAVIGWPVAHSASPRMHQPALDEAGIAARYVKIAVEPGQVAKCFRRMRALGFLGCNVTVPHKLDALAACDGVDPGAQEMGAVNTVRFDADATRGFNTDGHGFGEAVHEAFGIGLGGLRIAIIGAGGGAGAALAIHCARAGAAGLVLGNRTLEKILPLAQAIRERHGLQAVAFAPGDPALVEAVRGCDLLVNATSLGLKDTDPPPLDPAAIRAGHYVFDTIYQPPVTPFLQAGAAAGAQTANGQWMLLHQGIRAFQIWFPDSDPAVAMRRGLLATGC